MMGGDDAMCRQMALLTLRSVAVAVLVCWEDMIVLFLVQFLVLGRLFRTAKVGGAARVHVHVLALLFLSLALLPSVLSLVQGLLMLRLQLLLA